jgi:glutamate formiminotransferase
MGAADVVPFIPLRDATLDVCIAMAERVGERIGRELQVPVYLYGHAAREGHSVELPIIRRGGFETLRDALPNDSARAPDYGPSAIHATAGATAVGARTFLVAFNVFLDTSDVRTADRVARQVRTTNGGLPCVQAKGFLVAGQAQVSMNLLDVDVVDPQTAFDAVARLARECGTNAVRSEFVGLVPEQAVSRSTETSLRLASRLSDHLLEPKVQRAAASDDGLGT